MKLNVGTYDDKASGWSGWVEPEDKLWILFVKDDGTPALYTKRDKTGAIQDEEPCCENCTCKAGA